MRKFMLVLAACFALASTAPERVGEKTASEVCLSDFNGKWQARCFYISGDEYAMSELDTYVLLEIGNGIICYSQGDAGEDDRVRGLKTLQATRIGSLRDGMLTAEGIEGGSAIYLRLQDDGTLTRNFFDDDRGEYVGYLFDRIS